jgi:hypothetical protein
MQLTERKDVSINPMISELAGCEEMTCCLTSYYLGQDIFFFIEFNCQERPSILDFLNGITYILFKINGYG